MKLSGRVLYLSSNAEELSVQLSGLNISPPAEYHYGVNTDAMISGRACTLGYTSSGLLALSGFASFLALAVNPAVDC